MRTRDQLARAVAQSRDMLFNVRTAAATLEPAIEAITRDGVKGATELDAQDLRNAAELLRRAGDQLELAHATLNQTWVRLTSS